MNPSTAQFRIRWEYTGCKGMEKLDQIFREELEAMAKDVGDHVVMTTQDYILGLEDQALIDTGHLLNSITTGWEWLNSYDILTSTGTNVPYAKYQEFGTRPHFVPFDIAPSLYAELQRKWNWVQPSPTEMAKLTQKGHNLWLKRTRDSRPMWGVRVTGEAQPFLQPGWSQSIGYIERRIDEVGKRFEERVKAGAGVAE